MCRSMTVMEKRPFRPDQPHSIEETGLPQNLVIDLVLRHAFFAGTITLTKLTEQTKLGPTIIHSIYRHFQKEHLCETRTMIGDDYQIYLSGKGREMADVALKKSHYAGPAPVPLEEYNRAVSAQGSGLDVTPDNLTSALEDLVLPDEVIKEIGAALVIGGATVLYGSTGNGKTSIAERLHRVFQDLVYVPYAVEVSGQILSVYDPLIHEAEHDEKTEHSRWVLCRRPMVKVGGEMRSDMLDPRIDEATRIGIAPLQMKANNGILLIDDFGRQRISPRELLNRWIVPLDRHTDILSLWSGISFEIPFQLLVIFATNLALTDLAEDAFMRRLKNKIKIEALTKDGFRTLLRRVASSKGIACALEIEDYIVEGCAERSPDGLRGCYPTDLISIILGMAKFEQRAPVLEKDSIDRALKIYFVH